MTSVTAFNDMMGQFLAELHMSFPEEKSIKKYMTAFELLRSANGRLVVDGFMAAIAPHMDKISAKDENFFIENAETIDFLKDINLKNIWPIASDNTREAIWQYIQTLYMLGTTITSIPPETLSMIESVAKQCADKLQEEGGDIDESQLMKSMQGLLGGMMKK
jgi:biotin operon repressor|tara:strand:+ start:13454 stop:13939 length:486 start_codon:yes stop_codon:yes gene_type:complete